MAATRPFFLFGFERSGTTLLTMMLGAHPELALPFSTAGMWFRFYDRLSEYDNLESRQAVGRLVDDIAQQERISMWDVDLDRSSLAKDMPLDSFAAVFERFHALYAEEKGKPRWGNVDIMTLERMDVVNRWFPDAQFIHIVRDGRDVALSHDSYQYGMSSTVECANQWQTRVFRNMKMGAMLDDDRYTIVRYEDLVLEPELALGAVCEFLGVAYSETMLQYPDMVDSKIPESRRSLWPLIGQAPKKDNAYRWKRKMGTVRQQVFTRTAGSLLTELGYDVSSQSQHKVLSNLYEIGSYAGRGHRLSRIMNRISRSK